LLFRNADANETLFARAERRSEAMDGWYGARCAGHDLAMRHKIDQVVFETRVQLAETFNKFADEAGEPPLTQEPTPGNTETR
jgi:hypothetical protein